MHEKTEFGKPSKTIIFLSIKKFRSFTSLQMNEELVFDEYILENKPYSKRMYHLENLVMDPTAESFNEIKNIFKQTKENNATEIPSLIFTMYQLLNLAQTIRPFQTLELSNIVKFVIQFEKDISSELGSKISKTSKLETKNKSIKARYSRFIKDKSFSLSFAEITYGQNSLGALISFDDVEKVAYRDVHETVSTEIFDVSSQSLSSIAFAAYCSAVNVFKYLMINGMEINDTVVMASVIGGNEDIIELIQNKGISFKGYAQTAIKYHRNNIAKWIIENYNDQSFDIQETIAYTNTLGFFYVNYHLKQSFPQYAADLLNAGQRRRNENPLFLSVEQNRIDFVEELLNAGANPNFADTYQNTPLFMSLSYGFLEIAEILISHPIAIEKRNALGCTALYVACESGYMNICKLLIAKKADVNARTKKGYTPLSISVLNKHFDIAQLLLDNKANINCKSNVGETILCVAAALGDKEIVNFLIQHGADVEIPNVSGLTPYYCALINGNFDIMNMLKKEANAKFDSKLRIAEEALFKCIAKNKLDSIKFLIENGVDLECHTNITQMTPLTYACSIQKPEVVEILLQHKCNTEAIDLDSHTPIYYAYLHGNQKTIDLLLSHGAENLIF